MKRTLTTTAVVAVPLAFLSEYIIDRILYRHFVRQERRAIEDVDRAPSGRD